MMKKLTGILEKARRLESGIAARVEGTVTRVTEHHADRQPLEIVHAIVDAVAREVQPTGRGRNGFPFNSIHVVTRAPTARAKALVQAVFDGPPSLQQRIEERLTAAGCAANGLVVQTTFASKARDGWVDADFTVEYLRLPDSRVAPPTRSSRIDLGILAGAAIRTSYAFGAQSIALGRGAEVRDARARLLRTNHVAFVEGDDEINQTVSRLHARIEHDAASGSYRVFDEGSSQGTSIVRSGRGHTVPRGTRGMTLESGDELVLGRARIKIKISG